MIIIGGMQKYQAIKTDGICTTLTSSMGTGGGYVPMVTENNAVEICALDEQNIKLRKETFGTLTTDGSSPKHNNRVMETVRIKCEVGMVADLSYPTSTTRRGRVQNMGRVSPTITAAETGVCKIESQYRIRKLTPKECWRIMDFSDEDFNKAEMVNSNTQLYKQAGNSIVKSVLEAIFRQMCIQNIPTWNEEKGA